MTMHKFQSLDNASCCFVLQSALWAVGERPGYQLEVRVEEQQV